MSDTFTVDQTQSCMQFLREIADDFPEDFRSVVKDGAKSRDPHTYTTYLVKLQRESDRHLQLSTALLWMMPWR